MVEEKPEIEKTEIQKIRPPSPKKKLGRPKGTEISFPSYSLKKTLGIIEAMENNYAGDPSFPEDIAQHLGTTLGSSHFRNLLISSHKYGLTNGTYKSEKIEMTTLGRQIVEPTSEEGKNIAITTALQKPEVFSKFFTKYNRKNVPDDGIIRNVLKNEFGVPHERAVDCVKVIRENITDYNLIHQGSGILRLVLTQQVPKLEAKEEEQRHDDATTSHEDTFESKEVGEEDQIKTLEKLIPKVFISHSKNANILDQLKTILEFGSFEYTIAEEVETAAIPIPDKIFGLMRECNCAIINVSADDELKNGEGSYRINENVLIEIGAAFVHYDKRVILLADKRVKLPSNLQGLYRCEYEGDELSFMVAMKLQKALTEFKKSLE